ncbi:hypothetical protein [Streptomyces sp. NPDC091268]|uniref:hypothetical protein n=1 Tax=Streptomyces sp. NPDC091268 TaxID=3365979 RepID=UPI0038244517
MGIGRRRARLAEEVHAVVHTVLGDPTVIDLPPAPASASAPSTAAPAPVPGALHVTAFDAADTRPAEVLAGALAGALRTAGWAVDEAAPAPGAAAGLCLYAAKAGFGGGSFAVRATAVSFSGTPDT